MSEHQEIIPILQEINRRLSAIEAKLSKEVSDKYAVQASSKPAARRVMSVKEYILLKAPKDDLQRTLAIASFLELHKGLASFTVNDLKEGFREARLKQPANINDKVSKNIAKGYVMDADLKDGKKSWVITMTGEQVIVDGFKEG